MKRTAFFLVLASLALLLAAKALAADAPPASPRVVSLALNDVLVVAEQKGWLKEELAPLGATAKLVPCSPQVVPALFERGEVDIANSMIGISLLQLINGFDPAIVWESADIHPRFITIVVPKDSPIKTLADLKGKTLAAAQWSDPHYAAYEALKTVGLTLDADKEPGDVRYVNVSDSGMTLSALLLSGRVDAVSTLVTGVSSLYMQGAIRDIGTGIPGGWFVGNERVLFYARRPWAKDNPDLIRGVLRAQERTVLWIRDHPAEASQIVFDQVRHPKDLVEFQFREPGYNRLALPGRDLNAAIAALKGFQKVAQANFTFLRDRKPLSDDQIAALYDPRFFQGGAYSVGDAAAPAPGTQLAGVHP